MTCIHVRWDQKDAKSSRLLCIARNPNDVTPPIITGNSLSEVLIFASINPKYDDTLIVELQVQYKKTTSSVLCWYTHEIVMNVKTKNNLLSYFGSICARMSASDKELPVQVQM